MLSTMVEAHLTELEEAIATVDRDAVAGEDAARLTVLFARGRRLYAAAETTFALRAQRTNAWRASGAESAGEWLAAQSGTPVGEAEAVLALAGRLEGLAEVDEAFRSGALSVPQAAAIADAATCDPAAQGELLAAARTRRFRDLKGLARRIKQQARSVEDDEATTARHQAQRRAGTAVDDDGMGRLWANLPPAMLGQIRVWLDAETDNVLEAARRDGCREAIGAYRADALVNLLRRGATGGGADGRPLSPRLLVRIDLAALQRGWVEGGEVCAIPGVGDVPVAAVRRLLPDSLLTLVVTKGVDVTTVASAGRHVPAAVDLALRWRDPTCVVPGCERSVRLERDHWRTDYADDGPTNLDNLARLCRPHHHEKTRSGARLSGGPGRWQWHPPPRGKPDPGGVPTGGVPGGGVPTGGVPPREGPTAGVGSAPTSAPTPLPAVAGRDPTLADMK